MELRDRSYHEKRMLLIRREALALGKFGMSTGYYLEHYAKLIGIARVTAERLERSKLQLPIPAEVGTWS